MKQRVKDALAQVGLRIERMSSEERRLYGGYDPVPAPSITDQQYLRGDNPRLRELQAAYAQDDSPVNAKSLWTESMVSGDVDLQHFRGDNLYVWQYTRSPIVNRLRYFIYARYIQSIDTRRLLDRLGEDGAFGCFTFDYPGMPTVSRDLLDSIGELTFLGTYLDLFDRPELRVLDIGAGYGRLAHRMLDAAPNVAHYYCTDAVPQSTFLNEFYLRHRGLDDRSTVVDLPAVTTTMEPDTIDLAVNVHSFSEMPMRAVAAWLQLVSALHVPWLFIVPNERAELLSREPDGRRVNLAPVLRDHGFDLVKSEPTILDPAVRDLLNVHDEFLLYERRRKSSWLPVDSLERL